MPQFNPATPAATQNGTAAIDSMRANLLALRDSIIAGSLPGWAATAIGPDLSQPEKIEYSNSPEKIRATITWGTAGGETGNPVQVDYDYSDDDGVTWTALASKQIIFTIAGEWAGTTWS